jgi:hypothetical protein
MLNKFESDLRNSMVQELKRQSSYIFKSEKEEGQCQIRYLGIDLNNFTKTYKKYSIEKYILSIIKKIPSEDLKGLDKINIYDDSFPKAQKGLYYPPDTMSSGAQIDIYLNPTLGDMVSISSKKGLFNRISNQIFLISFGKLFLTEALLHEVGHHNCGTRLGKRYKTQEEKEEDANNYFVEKYRELYPFISRYYSIINTFYHLLFKRRIRKSNEYFSERAIYDPRIFFREAIVSLKAGDFKKAIEDLNRVIELDPTNHYAYSNRALAKYGLGVYEEAIKDLTLVISLNPEYLGKVYYYRGECYRSMDAFEKAITDYVTAIRLGYSNGDLYLSMSYCYMQLHEYEKAKANLDEAVKRGINESQIPLDLKEIMEIGKKEQ